MTWCWQRFKRAWSAGDYAGIDWRLKWLAYLMGLYCSILCAVGWHSDVEELKGGKRYCVTCGEDLG